MTTGNATYAQIQMELTIAADPEAVWQALVDDIGQWWPADFYAGGQQGKRTFKFEAEPGGRMVELWDDGGGLLWGTVITVEPNKRLQALGTLFPNWGGPALNYATWELEKKGSETVLRFSESTMGRLSDDGMEEKDKGWRFLMESMKAHIEGNDAPTW